MQIVNDPRDMQRLSRELHAKGTRIGLVPTMGALHEAHLTLLDRVRQACDTAVMSIYVNPTQFGPHEDFDKYPRPFEQDCRLAGERGCDIVFAPEHAAMYPPGYATYVEVETLTANLCGASRPGHFRGVTTIVTKLINAVGADVAVFGQKDAQQALIIRRMAADLHLPCEIIIAPIVREPDGLALSSRNVYLSPEERRQALTLNEGLSALRARYESGERSVESLLAAARDVFRRAPLLDIEYLEAVDTDQVQPISTVDSQALVAVACRTTQSGTRLIDNVVLGGNLQSAI